jgi:hypothetical protein
MLGDGVGEGEKASVIERTGFTCPRWDFSVKGLPCTACLWTSSLY